MRILVDIGHPGHVHFYKNAMWQLESQGHEVCIAARDKDVTLELLDLYSFDYLNLSTIGNSSLSKYREFLQREWALMRLMQKFKPDVVTEIGGVFIAPVCKLLQIPSVVFTDTEHVAIDRYLTHPFATIICTPHTFKRELKKNHCRYQGYHELAYLHPNYFQPDPSVLTKLGVSDSEPFIVLRFVAWNASHDAGQTGFSNAFKRNIIETLSNYGRVFITSEDKLPAEFESCRITVPPHQIHSVLTYASLYLGEGATMATEAGLLGTPSVYVSSLVGTMGNFEELMDKYRLVYSYRNPMEALQKAVSLLREDNIKEEWARRRQELLTDTIDVTQFITDTLEKNQS